MSFNGNKLLELRLLKGWSRFELAQLLNVSEQAIWQFETRGLQPDQSSTMMKLVRLFDVSLLYFQDETTPEVVEAGRIAFRNGDFSSKRIVQIQEAYINKVHSIFKYMENYLVPPRWIISDLLEKVHLKQKNGISLEELAEFVREFLDISDDNHDLLFKIERSGVNVLSKIIDIDKNADAYSLWTKDNTPYIILGKGKSSVRRNFDLAHELGHLLLHTFVDFNELDAKQLKEKEREADCFASYLLLPREIFTAKFDKLVRPKVSNPKSYIPMKIAFNVSIQALEYRAYKLGYLTQEQNNYFYRVITKKGYKKLEPLDDTLVIKKPGKIASILDMLLKSGQVTVSELLDSLHVTIKFLVEHLDLEVDFFETYTSKEEDYGQIIQLNSYQRKA
ncbi:XRE family transcriptional regulator [Lactococcus lactis]|uniref:XRE family transcriptional regulator n=1 Tax=Lactococcus lactis TaxID=1358 RepID=A0AAP5P4P4_9LACT|nr:XRE family transcriptional regulator [Lactococcus lactis]MDT2858526.1 XRE family transcriptional regulator [Lactococcus lactis]MDT2866658.1 XRE family transcriptional regulator [Lactococcus lactis]MDT2872657.1 XRE family transcriptional regulator [Lactococcus lactis]MDT2877564.1 XRE family transcriptional regulator [Lactococcus lactis]MDT2880066.1 XRE family transcriptional regulator [Lactococcus lactis]